MKNLLFCAASCAACRGRSELLLAPDRVMAQDSRGVIAGDTSQTPPEVCVPGASVVVTNEGTNVARESRDRLQEGLPGSQSQLRELQRDRAARRLQNRGAAGNSRCAWATSSASNLTLSDRRNLGSGDRHGRGADPRHPVSAFTGTTVESKQIAELPLGDGTAYMLTRLAPGITDNVRPALLPSRPTTATSPASSRTACRAATSSRSTARRTCRTRAASASRRLPTPSPSSRFRRTRSTRSPATPRVPRSTWRSRAVRIGFKGAFSYFNRDASRAETPLLTERAGGAKPTRTYNRFTGMLSGSHLQGPHVLHDRGRAPARRPARTRELHGSHGQDARRRLLRVRQRLVYDPLTATPTGTRSPFARQRDSRRTASARWPRPTPPCTRCPTGRAPCPTTSPTSSGPTTTTRSSAASTTTSPPARSCS
jgi:hypothetical protein